MKKRHFITLFTFFLFSIATYAQSSRDARWQEHKQKIVNKIDEDQFASSYTERLSDIVNLSLNQKSILEEAYRAYISAKKKIYKKDGTKHNDQLLIKEAHTEYKFIENKTLSSDQKELFQSYYDSKKEELKEKRLNNSITPAANSNDSVSVVE